MTSRERVQKAIRHEVTDRVPLDLGSTPVTGIAASTYARLREALGLRRRPVKVVEPFQMLAEVEPEVMEKMGVDTVGLELPTTIFGFRNENWKPWRLFDGTDVLVSEHFQISETEEGDLLLYPQGDPKATPCARMPKGGYYFDMLNRQENGDERHLDPEDFAEQFGLYTDEDLKYLQQTADKLYRSTDFSIVGCFWQGGFGDIAQLPGPGLKHPRGIRDPQQWLMAHVTHPEYIRGIFEIQARAALENLKLYRDAVGDRIDVIVMSGTDFGTQCGLFVSPEIYRKLYKPFQKMLNDWVHTHTPWKTFYHSCGAITALLDDFTEIGVDILNPVQCSAKGMDPRLLKERYGDKIVFWGGGVDTQKTLPFGSPEDVVREVKERTRILGSGGGFVFNTIHNIQHGVPVENLLAMFNTFRE